MENLGKNDFTNKCTSKNNIVKLTEEEIDAQIKLANESLMIQIKNLRKISTNCLKFSDLSELKDRLKSIVDHAYGSKYKCGGLEYVKKNKSLCANVFIETNAIDTLSTILEDLIGKYFAGNIDDMELFFLNHFVEDSICSILFIFIDSADASLKFGKEICERDKLLDLFYKVISELKGKCLNGTISESHNSILSLCVKNIYNTLIYEDSKNVTKIREKNFLLLFQDFMKCPYQDIQISALFVIAYIAGESEAEMFKSDPQLISSLIVFLKDSLDSKSKKYPTAELSRGIDKLSKNEANKRFFVDLGILPVLKTMMNPDSMDHTKAALSILWSLAFDDRNKLMIKKEFSSTLKDLKNSFNAKIKEDKNIKDKDFIRAYNNCKKVYDGLMWTLSGCDEFQKIDSNTTTEKHIMISYCSANLEMPLKIYDNLKSRNYKLWIKKYDVTDNYNKMETMAQAVQNSFAIIVCYSQNYKSSDKCRAEALYAKHRKVQCITVRVQQKYDPDGWLGFYNTGLLYCDFAGSQPFEESFSILIQHINRIRKSVESEVVRNVDKFDSIPMVLSNSLSYSPSHLKYWTNLETMQWFKNIGIEKINWKSHYTGLELEFLKTICRVPGETFFQICENKFEITDLKDLRILFQNLQELR